MFGFLSILLMNWVKYVSGRTILPISYHSQIYEMKIMEAKPKDSISIFETDLEVEFVSPLGYVEPDYAGLSAEKERKKRQGTLERVHEYVKKEGSVKVFEGIGKTIKGKEKENLKEEVLAKEGLILPKGMLFFGYPVRPLQKEQEPNEVFQGKGVSLRSSKK